MTGGQAIWWNSLSRSLNLFWDGTNSKLTFLSILIEKLHICPRPESWQRKYTTAVHIWKTLSSSIKKIISRFCRIHPKMTQMKPFLTFSFSNDLFSVEIWFRISKIWSKICHMNSRSLTIADKKSIFLMKILNIWPIWKWVRQFLWFDVVSDESMF